MVSTVDVENFRDKGFWMNKAETREPSCREGKGQTNTELYARLQFNIHFVKWLYLCVNDAPID